MFSSIPVRAEIFYVKGKTALVHDKLCVISLVIASQINVVETSKSDRTTSCTTSPKRCVSVDALHRIIYVCG